MNRISPRPTLLKSRTARRSPKRVVRRTSPQSVKGSPIATIKPSPKGNIVQNNSFREIQSKMNKPTVKTWNEYVKYIKNSTLTEKQVVALFEIATKSCDVLPTRVVEAAFSVKFSKKANEDRMIAALASYKDQHGFNKKINNVIKKLLK